MAAAFPLIASLIAAVAEGHSARLGIYRELRRIDLPLLKSSEHQRVLVNLIFMHVLPLINQPLAVSTMRLAALSIVQRLQNHLSFRPF